MDDIFGDLVPVCKAEQPSSNAVGSPRAGGESVGGVSHAEPNGSGAGSTVLTVSRAELAELVSAAASGAVEASFSRLAKSLRSVLEDMSKRLDESNESSTELRSATTALAQQLEQSSTHANARFTAVDMAVREVERGVQALRDKAELNEAQRALAKLSSTRPTAEATELPRAPAAVAAPAPAPAPASAPTPAPVPTPEPLPVPVPQYAPPQQQEAPPPQQYMQPQVPQHAPLPQMGAAPGYGPQMQQAPPPQAQPPQMQYAPPSPASAPRAPPQQQPWQQQQQQQPWLSAPPPQQHALPPQAQPQYAPPGPQQQPPQQPPQYAPPPQQQQQYASGPPPAQYTPQGLRPPSLSSYPSSLSSGGYGHGPPPMGHHVPPQQQQQQLPQGGGHGAVAPAKTASRSVPLDQIISDITSMGFERRNVISLVSAMQRRGDAIDLNKLVDKLTRGDHD